MNTKLRIAGCILLASSIVPPVLAQSPGAEIFKAKCQMCHGPAGLAESGAGKVMKVKPVTDPEVKAMSEAQMMNTVRKGAAKMQAYQGQLTDAQIKDVVAYFRTFLK